MNDANPANSATEPKTKTWAVFYKYGQDDSSAERREILRPLHRNFLLELNSRGLLPAFSRFTDAGPAGALLIAKGESAAAVFDMLQNDPYQDQGLVLGVNIREWPGVWLED